MSLKCFILINPDLRALRRNKIDAENKNIVSARKENIV